MAFKSYFISVKKLVLIVLVGFLLATVCPPAFCVSLPFSTKAEDGLVLKGTLYLPDGVKEARPVVILLPMMANDRKSWGDFPKKLSAAGYVVLAMDQRGHGESVWRGKKKVTYSQFTNGDFAKMVSDLDAVLAVLAKEKNADISRAGILGASIGANAALVYAAGHPAVKAVALLSPGMEYRGITTAEAAAAYGNRPALVVASKDDSYSASSAQKLAGKIGATASLKIYDGAEHGTRLFAEQKDFGQFLLDWTTAHFPVSSSPQK